MTILAWNRAGFSRCATHKPTQILGPPSLPLPHSNQSDSVVNVTLNFPVICFIHIFVLCLLSQTRDYSSGNESDEVMQNTKKKQRKYDPGMWESALVHDVTHLPEGIDGLVVYNIANISDSQSKRQALATDGRKWKKSNVTEWKKYGPMRYSNCYGSYKCTNETCPFRTEYGVINRTQFKRHPYGEDICRICESVGGYVPCPARRYIKEGKKSVVVFHLGTHTCPLLSKPEKPTEKVQEMFKKNPKLTPSEIQSSLVMSSLRKGEDWETVESKAEKIVDRKWISNQKQNAKKEIHPSGENFEAVVTFKLYCDEKDNLLVYKVNDSRGNPDMPFFVFLDKPLKNGYCHENEQGWRPLSTRRVLLL